MGGQQPPVHTISELLAGDNLFDGICHVGENGVTKAQSAAMKAGSMFGWDKPAADPANYDDGLAYLMTLNYKSLSYNGSSGYHAEYSNKGILLDSTFISGESAAKEVQLNAYGLSCKNVDEYDSGTSASYSVDGVYLNDDFSHASADLIPGGFDANYEDDSISIRTSQMTFGHYHSETDSYGNYTYYYPLKSGSFLVATETQTIDSYGDLNIRYALSDIKSISLASDVNNDYDIYLTGYLDNKILRFQDIEYSNNYTEYGLGYMRLYETYYDDDFQDPRDIILSFPTFSGTIVAGQSIAIEGEDGAIEKRLSLSKIV